MLSQNTVSTKFLQSNNIENRYVLSSIERQWRSNFILVLRLFSNSNLADIIVILASGLRSGVWSYDIGTSRTFLFACHLHVCGSVQISTPRYWDRPCTSNAPSSSPFSLSSSSLSSSSLSLSLALSSSLSFSLATASERQPTSSTLVYRVSLFPAVRYCRTDSKMQIVWCKCAGIACSVRRLFTKPRTYVRFFLAENNTDTAGWWSAFYTARTFLLRDSDEFYPAVKDTRNRERREWCLEKF